MTKIKSFVFLDLEGTGINAGNKIVEIAMVSIHRQAIRSGDVDPRVVDKLVICVDPEREIEFVESGFTRPLLTRHGRRRFDASVGDQVVQFLERQEQPACLIAHNGTQFDFLVLAKKLSSVGVTIPDVRCGDSLAAFRELQPGKPKGTPSRRLSPYKLENLYVEAFKTMPEKTHSAEADAIVLMQIVINAGTTMCRWFDENGVDKLQQYCRRSCPRLNIA